MISQQNISEISTRLTNELGALQTWLFGSNARGQADENSDIDILIVIPKSEQPRYKRNQMARRLVKDITIPKDIIIVTKDEWDSELSVPSSLCCTVKREGRLLHG